MTDSKYVQPIGYVVAALLIGYGLFSENGIFFRIVSPPTQTVATGQTHPAATPSAPVYSLTKTPIKDIKVGTRVPAFDPQLGTEIRETFADPNWSQWIKLHLELTKSDGSLLKMEMLRAEDWVLEQIDYQFLDQEDLQATSPSTAARSSRFLNALPLEPPSVPLRPLFEELHDVRWLMSETDSAAVLVTIALDLPEIGVRGEAVVTGVEPCPAILPGPGKVVLTTFHHASSDLIDLYLSPQPPTGSIASQQTAVDALLYPQVSRASVVDQAWERIGVTGNHPIWSEDRHDYVAAMDLRVGERLKNLSGDTVWVQQKLPRPGPTPVYNLEVQDEHVYYVGANGVLAHNAREDLCKTSGATTEHNVVYRALNAADAEALAAGRGLRAKAPGGTWTAAEHVANQPLTSGALGDAARNSPWLSTSRLLDVARAYDSGHGIIAIDLNRVVSFRTEVWRHAPRVNGVRGLAYHRSFWAQEVTIFQEIPASAILGLVKQ